MNIGRNIRYYRKKAGLSGEELGKKLGVTAQCILQIERGERGIISKKFIEIADVLNIEVNDLFSSSVPLALGEKIEQGRKSKGLTQSQLSEKLKVAEVTIRKWEKGEREPNLETLKRIVDILEIDISDLFSGEIQKQQGKFIDIKALTTQELTNLIMEATQELASRAVIK